LSAGRNSDKAVILKENTKLEEKEAISSGKLAKVTRLYSRADGYYWPQCQVDQKDLLRCMKEYVRDVDSISIYKQRARLYAEKSLNWKSNDNRIFQIFDDALSGQATFKEDLCIRIEKFENGRKSLMMKISLKYPRFGKIMYRFNIFVRKILFKSD